MQAQYRTAFSSRYANVHAAQRIHFIAQRQAQRTRPRMVDKRSLKLVDMQCALEQHDPVGVLSTREVPASTSEPLRTLLQRIFDSRYEATGIEVPVQHPEVVDARQHRPSTSSSEDSEDSVDSETCVVAHPGSLCCSTTTVQRLPATKTVVINLKTTVKLSNPKCTSVSIFDLERLGFISGAQQLQTAAGEVRSGSRTVQARHDAVLDLLQHGQIVQADRSTNQFGHVTYKCVLQNPQTHERIDAIVKPSIEGDCHGWHRAAIETVTYRLNRLFGMDYVPPCVYRTEMDVDWKHYNGGSFMFWANNGRELRTQPKDRWGVHSDVLLSDTRILDVLIQNSDRHHGHFLFAEHWARGAGAPDASKSDWKGTMLPVLIDHAAGFRPEAFVDMRHENAFNTGAVSRISARTYLRLRCVNRSVLTDALGDLLTSTELNDLVRRRDDVLQYFDKLVAEHGYEQVVIECPQS